MSEKWRKKRSKTVKNSGKPCWNCAGRACAAAVVCLCNIYKVDNFSSLDYILCMFRTEKKIDLKKICGFTPLWSNNANLFWILIWIWFWFGKRLGCTGIEPGYLGVGVYGWSFLNKEWVKNEEKSAQNWAKTVENLLKTALGGPARRQRCVYAMVGRSIILSSL